LSIPYKSASPKLVKSSQRTAEKVGNRVTKLERQNQRYQTRTAKLKRKIAGKQ